MNKKGLVGVFTALIVASTLTACGPGADGSTDEGAEGAGSPPPQDDGAKSAPVTPAPSLKPLKLKQHVD